MRCFMFIPTTSRHSKHGVTRSERKPASFIPFIRACKAPYAPDIFPASAFRLTLLLLCLQHPDDVGTCVSLITTYFLCFHVLTAQHLDVVDCGIWA